LAVVRHQRTDHAVAQCLPCRVLFVFRTADQKMARTNREKAIAKRRAGLAHLPKSVTVGRRHTDPTAIARRVAKLFGERQAARSLRYAMIPLSMQEPAQVPPPPRGCRRSRHRFPFPYEAPAAERDAVSDGSSALVATAPCTHSADVLFRKYPGQTSAPSGAPVAAQRRTTPAILGALASFTLLIAPSRPGREVPPTRLATRPREVLQQGGFGTSAPVLSRRLPRAP
jgi:hypothetical protein